MNRQKCLAKLKKACLITMVLGIILFFVDNTFSLRNAASLRLISRLMAVACAMMAVGFVVYLATSRHNPNLWMLGLIALGVCIALIFSLFASALAELIRYGARIKQENDLTI